MLQGIYSTPEGKIAVLKSGSRWDEYTVASLFRAHGGLVFAQLVGYGSPRPYLEKDYDVTKIKREGGEKGFVYTISRKSSFNYKLPFPEDMTKVFITPTREAAESMLKKLVGIYDMKELHKYFTVEIHKDEGPMDRVALYVTQKHSTTRANRGDILERYTQLEKEPLYFKGGTLGNE